MKCPRCNGSIEKLQIEYGLAMMCQSCFGHFLHEKNILKFIPVEKWNQTLSYAKNKTGKERITCPSCKSLMDTYDLPEEYNFIPIDRCPKCKVIWFDKDKIEDLNLKNSSLNKPISTNKNIDQVAQGLLLNLKLEQKQKELKRMQKDMERAGVDDNDGLYETIRDVFD